MERALNEVRFGGQQIADVFVYKARGGRDLPRPKEQLKRAAIYYLFGRASTVPDYAICDEDMLEFLQSLQQEKCRPPLLFDAFRDHHLLLIGLHFADWLARFFLRVAKPSRLSDPRDVLEIVADGDMNRDHDTVGSSAITRHPWVIPVVACDLVGRPIGYSNLGSSIGRRGLSAPGDNVTSLGTNGKPLTLGGTSAAAPFVTGAVALLCSLLPSTDLAEVKLAVIQASAPHRATVVPPLLNAWMAYQFMKLGGDYERSKG